MKDVLEITQNTNLATVAIYLVVTIVSIDSVLDTGSQIVQTLGAVSLVLIASCVAFQAARFLKRDLKRDQDRPEDAGTPNIWGRAGYLAFNSAMAGLALLVTTHWVIR